MEIETAKTNLICRLCLCKCENPRNMLIETQFASKVMQVFPKIQISPENDLTNYACDYCHNLIEQFYGYFETVNANQDDLLRIQVLKEEVFAVPLGCLEENQNDVMKNDTFNDTTWSDHDEPGEIVVKEEHVVSSEVNNTNESPMKMDYFELMKLPLNYTSSYICPLCTKSESYRFKERSDVIAHIMETHQNSSLQKFTLIEAQRITKTLKSFCDLCGSTISKFRKSQAFIDHKFIHYKIKPYKCDLCQFSTNTKKKMRIHIIDHEKRVGRKGCFYCIKGFVSIVERDKHIRQCHPHKIITCDLCGAELLAKHLAKHHFLLNHNSSNIECDRCIGGIKFPNEHVLALHKKRHEHEDKTKKRYACHLCERKFSFDYLLKAHLRHHGRRILLPCDICGKTILLDQKRISSGHAKIHLKQHVDLKCGLCGEEFQRKEKLSVHITRIHNRKEQSCYKCGKMIASFMMKRHLTRCGIDYLFECLFCPMKFAKKSEKRMHTKKEHTGFRCVRCNVTFEFSKELKRHQKHDEYHKRTIVSNNRNKNKKKNLEISRH